MWLCRLTRTPPRQSRRLDPPHMLPNLHRTNRLGLLIRLPFAAPWLPTAIHAGPQTASCKQQAALTRSGQLSAHRST